jgi:hypothetical protein
VLCEIATSARAVSPNSALSCQNDDENASPQQPSSLFVELLRVPLLIVSGSFELSSSYGRHIQIAQQERAMIRTAIIVLTIAAAAATVVALAPTAGAINYWSGTNKPIYLKGKLSTDCVAECVLLAW